MIIKMPISLIVVFTLLVLNAYAILEPSLIGEDGESLADKLIDESVGKIPQPHVTEPQEARAQEWKSNSLLSTPTPNTLSALVAAKNPQTARTESQGRVNQSSAALMSDTTVASSSVGTKNPTPSSADLAGTWSLDLNDTSSKEVVLTLFQFEDKVFGSGSMKNGDDTLVVAASGALKEDQIYLDITSIGTISLYSLVMTSSGDRGDLVSGNYKAYMANGQTWMGKIQGSKSLPIS
jgi:hypothetical protein